jgi:hypothetical protein
MEIVESTKQVIIHMNISPLLSYFCPADWTSLWLKISNAVLNIRMI